MIFGNMTLSITDIPELAKENIFSYPNRRKAFNAIFAALGNQLRGLCLNMFNYLNDSNINKINIVLFPRKLDN